MRRNSNENKHVPHHNNDHSAVPGVSPVPAEQSQESEPAIIWMFICTDNRKIYLINSPASDAVEAAHIRDWDEGEAIRDVKRLVPISHSLRLFGRNGGS